MFGAVRPAHGTHPRASSRRTAADPPQLAIRQAGASWEMSMKKFTGRIEIAANVTISAKSEDEARQYIAEAAELALEAITKNRHRAAIPAWDLANTPEDTVQEAQ